MAEDQPESSHLLVSWLRSLGFEVREARDGEQTLREWENWAPDLIWMDMRMPVLDGYTTTRLIRSHQEHSQPVIIAVTASAFEEDRSEVLAAGCDDFVRKPLRLDQVLETMAHHLPLELIEDTDVSDLRQTPALTSGDLATLEVDLLRTLDRAATDINIKQLQEVIGDSYQVDPQMAQGLAELVDQFEFQYLQDLLQDLNR